jgi:hypothetical protein
MRAKTGTRLDFKAHLWGWSWVLDKGQHNRWQTGGTNKHGQMRGLNGRGRDGDGVTGMDKTAPAPALQATACRVECRCYQLMKRMTKGATGTVGMTWHQWQLTRVTTHKVDMWGMREVVGSVGKGNDEDAWMTHHLQAHEQLLVGWITGGMTTTMRRDRPQPHHDSTPICCHKPLLMGWTGVLCEGWGQEWGTPNPPTTTVEGEVDSPVDIPILMHFPWDPQYSHISPGFLTFYLSFTFLM